jgi:hypothetical protein
MEARVQDSDTIGRVVVALFRDRSAAEGAIRDLKAAGFTNEQIGVATQDQIGSPSEKAVGTTGDEQVADGATAGVLTGGIVGGLVGLISSLLVPGVGPLVVGGVLASFLTGMGIGAAGGGLIGALVGMGVPESDAQYFNAGLREGRTLLTVSGITGAAEALAILEHHEADLGPPRDTAFVERDQAGSTERRIGAAEGYTGPERRRLAQV